jgi:heme exporter protein D
LKINEVGIVFYKLGFYLWVYLGMAYISLIVNLLLEFFKENAANIRKELMTIIEEKVVL